MSRVRRVDAFACPRCAAPTDMRPAVELMPEHMQAREATGGERIDMKLVAEFQVTKGSPGGDQQPGTYRRWRCEMCGFSETTQVRGEAA